MLPSGQLGNSAKTGMSVPSQNFRIFLLGALALIAQVDQAYAACTRSDVAYYLSKRFTTYQITKICTASPPPPTTEHPASSVQSAEPAASVTPPEKAPPADTAVATPQPAPQGIEQDVDNRAAGDDTKPFLRMDTEQFLRTAIKGEDIFLTGDSLHYTIKMCIQYGGEDLFGFVPTACPHVKFVVALKRLEVLRSDKRYILFGPAEITIKGEIKRDIIGGLEDQKPWDRKMILKKFETGDKTVIPIREGISLDRVAAVLEQLAT